MPVLGLKVAISDRNSGIVKLLVSNALKSGHMTFIEMD